MTDTAMNNALFLGVAIIVASMIIGRLFSRSGEKDEKGKKDGLRPFGCTANDDASASTMTKEEIETLLARRYRIKFFFRLGVLVCSLGACGAYILLQNRILAMVLIFCAALCQYGVYKHKTNSYLAQALLRQGGIVADAEGGSRSAPLK